MQLPDVNTDIMYLKEVGPKRGAAFKKINISTMRDLLFFFPTKHLDRTNLLSIKEAYKYVLNGYDGELTIIAHVYRKEKIHFGKKQILKVMFRDESGFFECVWFQGVQWYEGKFNQGETYAVSGKPQFNKYEDLQIIHPDLDKLTDDENFSFLNTGKIIPFYRIPNELKKTNIGDLSLRRMMMNAVEKFADYVPETLPDHVIKEHKLISINETIKNFHFPENHELLGKALQRLKFEEFYYFEILAALRRQNYISKVKSSKLHVKSDLIKTFITTLPFKLTDAQKKVVKEITSDMTSEHPMNRLLQGDVGSGKTIVALIAMLMAVDNGYQAALMAPTEILAAQHAKNISALMNKLHEAFPDKQVKVSLLLGGQKASEKRKSLQDIELQEADIIIGTHALFEGKVTFKKLKLIVIDEQHRFGVDQRSRLQEKGSSPDVLVMSATPIPRTLSMTLYGDLDVSIIDELPANRKKIQTALRGESALPKIYQFIVEKAKEGIQSFIVYPLVQESEKLELKAAEEEYQTLKETFLKDVRVGLLHGQMPWQQKDEIMIRFKNKEFDVLVSTVVIEVGIDIPNANIMLINDAFRFGMSQLHQLRGRVGRGNEQSYCILVARDEFVAASKNRIINFDYLSQEQIEKQKTIIRLQAMVQYTDGFKLAEIDFKLRGPGNIFSTQQSGYPDLKYSDLTEDFDILKEAKVSAFKVIADDPRLTNPNNKLIKENLYKNYLDNLKYINIA